MALAGWQRARDAAAPERPLADGIPALVLSAFWTGPLALLCGPMLSDWWMGTNSSAAHAGLLLAALGMLLGAPGLLAYAAGRLQLNRPTMSRHAPLRGAAFLAITGTLAALYRWAREDKHYLPGAGDTPAGYVVARASTEQRLPARSPEEVASVRELDGAWDGNRSAAELCAARRSAS